MDQPPSGLRRRSRGRIRAALTAGLAACVAGALLVAPASGTAAVASVPPGFVDTPVLSGLDLPTVAAFAPNGRVFIGEQRGIVKTYDSLADTTPTITADLRDQVHGFWDRGLLGLAVDPQFPARPYLYVLYTYDALPGGTHPMWGTGCPTPPGATADGCVVTGRLARLTLNSSGVATGSQIMLTDWCQQYPSHSIGTVAFGPDGALYVSAGDGASFTFVDYGQRGNPCGDPPGGAGTNLSAPDAKGGSLRSQSPRRGAAEPVTLDGTVIRIHPDTGAAMPGNPFAASGDTNKKRIIAYGLRNPFRMAFRPGTSELWVGDVGWDTWEDINRIPDVTDGIARNFGWPCYEGPDRQTRYEGAGLTMCTSLYTGGGHVRPYYAYRHGTSVVAGDGCATSGSSITGLTFEDGTSNYPPAYQGALFFADQTRGCVWAMRRGASGQPDPATIVTLASGINRPVQLLIGPGGDLFYVSYGSGAHASGELRRISYPDGAYRPPVAVASASPTSGPTPLSVQFDGTGSIGRNLSYAWDLTGNGSYTDSASATPSRTYDTAGLVRVGLRVTDDSGRYDTATVDIEAGTPPEPVIASPAETVSWQVGQSVSFSGSARDGSGAALPASALSWRLDLHHCVTAGSCHVHHLQDFTGVTSGSFVAPDHEYPAHLELTLTARDATGLTANRSVSLQPKTVGLSFTTSPSGFEVIAGSTKQATPFTTTVIVGSATSISAPGPQWSGGVKHWFASWSDGGARSHEVVAPASSTNYRAAYRSCVVDGVSVDPCDATPSAARFVTARGGVGRATVRWQPPVWPGEGGLTKYRITVSPGGHVVDNISPAATSRTVTGLAGGTSYRFTVRAYSAAGASPAASKRLIGTKVSSAASASTITHGSSTTISGRVYRADTGIGYRGGTVELQGRRRGATTWTTLTTGTTGSGGAISFTRKPSRHYEYRLRYLGSSNYLGAVSPRRGITVRQRVTGSFSSSTVNRGSTVSFTGSVVPNHAGQRIHLQRYYGGRWNRVASTTLSATSTYTFRITRSTAGSVSYRTHKPADADHATGYSPRRTLTVR